MSVPSPVRHIVSPAKPAQAVQLLQGGYYVAAGCLTAVAAGVWMPPVGEVVPTPGWGIRVAGAVFAAFGVALVLSGRRGGRHVPAGAGMWAALAAVVIETGGLAIGVLPGP